MALQEFVVSSLGRPYSINTHKIFVRKKSHEFDEDGNEIVNRSSGKNGILASPEESQLAEKKSQCDLTSAFSVCHKKDRQARDMEIDAGLGGSGSHRTFFCSELVAACLKRAGVLAGARASSTFWPG